MSPLRRRYRHVPLARPVPRSEPDLDQRRSVDACPVCGRHTLSLLGFPDLTAVGAQPYSEILGMGEARVQQEPGIACLSCGSEWRDIEAFRAAQAASQE